MDQPNILLSVIWFIGALVLSIWGSGLNLFGKPRWVVPRIMLTNYLFGLLDFVLLPFSRCIYQGKKPHIFFRDHHREHNTFIHRLNEWLLHVSDHENLTLAQKDERLFWTGGMIVSIVMLLLILCKLVFRAIF